MIIEWPDGQFRPLNASTFHRLDDYFGDLGYRDVCCRAERAETVDQLYSVTPDSMAISPNNPQSLMQMNRPTRSTLKDKHTPGLGILRVIRIGGEVLVHVYNIPLPETQAPILAHTRQHSPDAIQAAADKDPETHLMMLSIKRKDKAKCPLI